MESGYLRSSDQHHHITVRVRRCPMPSLISPCLPAPCFLPSTLSHDLCSSPRPTMLAPPLPLTFPALMAFPLYSQCSLLNSRGLFLIMICYTVPAANSPQKSPAIIAHHSPLTAPITFSCYLLSLFPLSAPKPFPGLFQPPGFSPTIPTHCFPPSRCCDLSQTPGYVSRSVKELS